MLHSKRSVVIKIASLLSALAMIAAVAAVTLTHAPSSAHAAPSAVPATRAHSGQIVFKGTSHPSSLLGVNASGKASSRTTTAKTHIFKMREVSLGSGPMKSNPSAPTLNAPSAAPSVGAGNLTPYPNFNGLANLQNDTLNGFELEPPDQGLCVGYARSSPAGPRSCLRWSTKPSRSTRPLAC